nr:hypothetical protein [uncultured Cetobacterium sp.]
MSNTIITLLKIILQGDIRVDEISKYIQLDQNSIDRNIHILNEYLKERGLNQIKRQHNIYSLEYSKGEIKEFFAQLDILSSKERQDILCIRFLLNGFINLEKERQKIGVSRTTAIKDWKIVKEYLESKDIFVESRNAKGIFLLENDSDNLRGVLCELIMKLFLDEEFLSRQRRELLEEIDVIDGSKYIGLYKKIMNRLGCQASVFSFYSIYAMLIIEQIKGDNVSYESLAYEMPKNKLIEIRKIIDEYVTNDEITDNMRTFFTTVMYNVSNFTTLDESSTVSFEKFYRILSDRFSLNEDVDYKLKENMRIYFIRGIVKRRYGVLSVKKEPKTLPLICIVEELKKILRELEIEMLYSDIVGLAECIVEFFIEERLIENLNILILVKDYSIEYVKKILKCFRLCHPNIIVNIESFLYMKFMGSDQLEGYDIIISDTEILTTRTFKRVDHFSISELEDAICDYVLNERMPLISEH